MEVSTYISIKGTALRRASSCLAYGGCVFLFKSCGLHKTHSCTADLHQIIKSGQTLTNEHVQYFVYQILRGEFTTSLLCGGPDSCSTTR